VDLGAELEGFGPHPVAETSPTSTIPIISTRVLILNPVLDTMGEPPENAATSQATPSNTT
jgi:hypothetical protein